VSAKWVYIDCYRWNHQRTCSVGDFTGESATSLYGDPDLNPLVIPSGTSSETNPHHHTVATFQKNYIVRRRYSRYIPMDGFRRYISTVSPTDVLCRYIPKDFETELFPSVKITDKKIPSVSPLIFTDFLVVTDISCKLS
jgi:hypothetical protein